MMKINENSKCIKLLLLPVLIEKEMKEEELIDIIKSENIKKPLQKLNEYYKILVNNGFPIRRRNDTRWRPGKAIRTSRAKSHEDRTIIYYME